MAPPTLAYWDIRGVAQPIRLLLAYTKTEFEDKYYVCGPAPNFDKSCWYDIKFSLGLDFPNLPYYIDGDVKLTQNHAILRYISRKHNLLGTNETEMMRVDLMENQITDFRKDWTGWTGLCYNPNYDTLKHKYAQELPGKLSQFSKFLGDHKWLAGENITFVDFMLYEMLDQHLLWEPSCLDAFPNLKSYWERFRALEPIQEYMKSSKFITRPVNNKMAMFK